jgi:hypothetical protein
MVDGACVEGVAKSESVMGEESVEVVIGPY